MTFPSLVCLGIGVSLAWTVSVFGDEPTVQELPDLTKKAVRLDTFGDPLPAGAVARLGTRRWRLGEVPLAFSPDGRHIIAVGSQTRLIDPKSGQEARQFDIRSTRAFFTPDSKVAMLADRGDVNLRFLDIAAGRIVRQFPVGAFVGGTWSPFWSADGKRLACFSIGPNRGDYRSPPTNVAVWDVDTAKRIRQWNDRRGYVALSPDGKMLAMHEDNHVVILDVDTDAELRRWESPPMYLGVTGAEQRLAFTPDGKMMAVAQVGRVALWELASSRPDPSKYVNLPKPQDKPGTFAFSPDGRLLAVCSESGSLHVWSLATNEIIHRWPQAGDITFSPDSKTLISKPRLWDVTNGKELSPKDACAGGILKLSFSQDGQMVASITHEDPISLWNPTSGALIRRLERFYAARISPFQGSFGFQPNGKSFAASDVDFLYGGRVSVWNVDDGRPMRKSQDHHLVFANCWLDDYTAVCVFPGEPRTVDDGNGGVTSVPQTMIGLWDRRTKKVNEAFGAEAQRFFELGLSPDRNTLVDVGEMSGPALERYLFVWDLKGKTEIFRVAIGQSHAVRIPTFSTDGRTLFTADFTTEIGREKHLFRLYEVASAKTRLSVEYKVADPHVTENAIHDERLAAVSCRDAIRLIDLVTGKELRHWKTGEGWIRCLAFSPDGKFLASGGDDTTALIWALGDLAKPPETVRLSASDVARLWADLARDDAAVAYQSILRLSQAPEQTVAFLSATVQPAPIRSSKDIERLLIRLESERYSEREQAAQDLVRLGPPAEQAVLDLLKNSPSLEIKRRGDQILKKIQKGQRILSGKLLREVRAVEVLERIGTPGATSLLSRLAKGAPHAVLTREATSSLERLAKGKSAAP